MSFNLSNVTQYPENDDEIGIANYIYMVVLLMLSVWMVFGNSLTLAAVVRFQTLRTPTNTFICCLAFTDLAVAFGLFFQVLVMSKWKPSERYWSCIMSMFLYFFPTSISVHFLQGISVDRFIAIHFPLRYAQLVTMRRVTIACFSIILFDVFTFVIPLLSFNTWNFGCVCQIETVMHPLYVQLVVVGLLYFSFLTITILYGITLRTALQQRRRIAIQRLAVTSSLSDEQKRSFNTGDIKAALGLAIVVGAFAVCFLPFTIVVLYDSIADSKTTWPRLLCNSMALANSGINPIIYGVKVPQFRRAFQKMGIPCICVKKRYGEETSASFS